METLLGKPGPLPQAAGGRGLTELEFRLVLAHLKQTFKRMAADEAALDKGMRGMVDNLNQQIMAHGEPPIEMAINFVINLSMPWAEILGAMRPAKAKSLLVGGK